MRTSRVGPVVVAAVAVAAVVAQTPVASAATTAIYTQISAGAFHTCALTTAGGVQCWGDNSSGELGDGTTIGSDGPVSVKGLSTGVTAVAAGDFGSCALTTAGAVKCWGDDSFGELGNGKTGTENDKPVQVKGLTSGATQVSAGGDHACAIVSGAAECWGENDAGELGNGTTTDSDVPVLVQGLTAGVTQVSAGEATGTEEHTCAVVSGAAWCWGSNGFGELGNGTLTGSDIPVPVSGLSSNVASITSGGAHSCATVRSIALFTAECWGNDESGQLGDGSIGDATTPVRITSGVEGISAGVFHTCAIVVGAAECWGADLSGEVGDGTTGNSDGLVLTPVGVVGLSGGVAQVSASGLHTCALLSSDDVDCWGDDLDGELGDGTTGGGAGFSDTPVPVANETALSLCFKTCRQKKVAEGATLTLKATVTCAAATPSGTVEFFIDGTDVGSAGLLLTGKATLQVSVTQSAGTHQVWAVYEGNPPFGGSHDVPRTLTVTP
jgi:alpha-tubulin suppressor-like RCC1 family protein